MSLLGGPGESHPDGRRRHSGRDRDPAWTRAELLRRAAGGAGGLALLGGGIPGAGRLLGPALAHAAPAAQGDVHGFFSRPDLKPPVVTVLHPAASVADGFIFLAPSSGPGQRGAMILDDDGKVVWFHKTYPRTAMDFRVQLYKGKPVLTWWEGKHEKGIGQVGEYVVLDGTYREIARFEPANGRKPDFHEYLLTPRGTALVTSHEIRPANLSSVGGKPGARVLGGVIQELAIPSGRVLWEWKSLDHVAIEEARQTDVGDPFDYFHLNSIGFDHDGNLIVSARNTWAVYKLDRRTGRVIWRLGGRKSDFRMGPGTAFAFQHDARMHDGGKLLSLFDNGPDPHTKPQSSGLILAVDTARRRVALSRRLRHSPPLYARVTGDTQFLPNGNVFVCYGSTGYFTEFDAEGRVRLDAKLPKGGQNYRVRRLPWTGRPVERPVLATHSTAAGKALYASWNGATDVAAWQLRAGSSRNRLADAARMPKDGFDTALPAPPGARYAVAVALDTGGKALATSAVVRV